MRLLAKNMKIVGLILKDNYVIPSFAQTYSMHSLPYRRTTAVLKLQNEFQNVKLKSSILVNHLADLNISIRTILNSQLKGY